MAYATHGFARELSFSSFRAWLNSLADRYDAWRRYRETVAQLSKLTDRELDDIGVSRADIMHIARGDDLGRGWRG